MRRAWKLGLAGVGVAGLGGYAWLVTERFRGPRPTYDLIETRGDVEFRRYSPRIVAATVMPGTGDEAKNEAFRRLAGYIFGRNHRAERILMTGPVETTPVVRRGERISMTTPVEMDFGSAPEMRFFMPPEYKLDTLPRPDDPLVRLERAPPKTVAVIRWHGRATERQVQRHQERLEREVNAAGWALEGEPTVAQYDAPYVLPLLRRTELLVPARRLVLRR